ncbi:HAD family phosphatase [Pelagibacteraceae bacterium]|nr:HAD family phosphatase [Pelagibacteraceae bacterium]
MIKNIIFDFDGVIVDSEVLASNAFAKYFSKFDKSIKEEQFYKYAGKKTVEVIDLLSAKYKIDNKEKFTNEIFDIVAEVYSRDLKLVDGAKDYISRSNRNHFIGSNSNKDRIMDGLKLVGLDKLFLSDNVYSFDMVKRPKPDPDIYLKVLNDNSLNIEETIIIEDSGVGVKAATSAGVRVFGLTAGKHWHSNRDKNELFDNGALNVFSDYTSLSKAIEEL